jgi:hypothetical protein
LFHELCFLKLKNKKDILGKQTIYSAAPGPKSGDKEVNIWLVYERLLALKNLKFLFLIKWL